MGLDNLDDVVAKDSETACYPDEQVIVDLVTDYFEGLGYSTNHNESRVIDVIAEKDEELWAIEVKGYRSGLRSQITSALGQAVYPLSLEDLERQDRFPAMAFPRELPSVRRDFRERVDQNISKGVLELLNLTVIFVDNSDIEVHPPGEIGHE